MHNMRTLSICKPPLTMKQLAIKSIKNYQKTDHSEIHAIAEMHANAVKINTVNEITLKKTNKINGIQCLMGMKSLTNYL